MFSSNALVQIVVKGLSDAAVVSHLRGLCVEICGEDYPRPQHH